MKPVQLTLFVLLAGTALFYACLQTTATAPPFAAIPPPIEAPPLDPDLQAFIDGYDQYFADSMFLTGTPGAAVVIVKDSQVVFIKGYGVKAYGSNDPVDEHTLFRLGSLSKGFAGTLTGILVKNGYLTWHDPVQQHYPAFALKDKKQAERVQVRHLLSHTTGLPYHAFGQLIELGHDRETITTQYFPYAKLYGQEGGFFGYQNVAFCVIEPVLQAVTGQTYQALLQEYIFRPAEMADASSDFETIRRATNKAMPHLRLENGWSADTISPLYYGFAAAGGLNASISDMGGWLKVLLGQRPDIVSNATLDEVFRPVIPTGLERRILPNWIERDSASYAMGWRILQHSGDTLVYHAGLVNNFHCEIALDRNDGIGVCVLFNANSPMRGKCIQSFFERWAIMKEQKACEMVE